MRTRSVILAIVISLSLVLAMTATSLATTIDFSGSTSDDTTDPSQLGAQVDYSFGPNDDATGGTLFISVSNQTSDYVISTLYFNITSDVSPQNGMVLSDYGPFPKAYLKAKSSDFDTTETYGSYDVILDFYKDSTKNGGIYNDIGILPGESAAFQVSVSGNNLDETDFFVPRSPSAILFFTGGPDGGSVYAASLSAAAAVPEPATLLLFGTGLVGLAGLRRKEFFEKP